MALAKLGFGTSQLMGRVGRKQSLRLMEVAFDAGIRHFDTAPLYGLGAAEAMVGEFARKRRAEITITSKFGDAPPPDLHGLVWPRWARDSSSRRHPPCESSCEGAPRL